MLNAELQISKVEQSLLLLDQETMQEIPQKKAAPSSSQGTPQLLEPYRRQQK